MATGVAERYIVRVAGAGELDAVVRLHHRRERPGEPLPDGPSELQRATWERMMATPILTIYVVEAPDDPSEIVANTCMTIVPNLINDCRSTAFVEPMLVAAPHRRRGVARLMVERLLADAATAGCYKIQLLSHKRHATDGAHAFYRSVGFVAEAEGFRYYHR